MSKSSKTDWNGLVAMEDKDIDTSDVPELDDEFFRKAELKVPLEQLVTLRLESDVVAWFKSQGQGYQTRINKLLRAYMEKSASKPPLITPNIPPVHHEIELLKQLP